MNIISEISEWINNISDPILCSIAFYTLTPLVIGIMVKCKEIRENR